ncbi:MAG: MOSC N-terminal beta barrel domain-containing protein [Actinomycetota bacterium]|nr:MOSC N-terminal beta barrel domain-containing protein [Actinomycetota bacterium]
MATAEGDYVVLNTEKGRPAVIVTELRRFPLRSMRGDLMTDVRAETVGFVGDRAHALLDRETGKVANAKDPRRWAGRSAWSDHRPMGTPTTDVWADVDGLAPDEFLMPPRSAVPTRAKGSAAFRSA